MLGKLAEIEAAINQPSKVEAKPSQQVARSEVQPSDPTRERYNKMIAGSLRELREDERPLFLELDLMASGSRGVGSTSLTLKESASRQTPFVLFPLDANTGMLYPHPKISFTEGMKYAFPGINYSNWPAAADSIQPKRVRKSKQGEWVTE